MRSALNVPSDHCFLAKAGGSEGSLRIRSAHHQSRPSRSLSPFITILIALLAAQQPGASPEYPSIFAERPSSIPSGFSGRSIWRSSSPFCRVRGLINPALRVQAAEVVVTSRQDASTKLMPDDRCAISVEKSQGGVKEPKSPQR